MALKADGSIASNVEDALDDVKWHLRPQQERADGPNG